jgi:outer membrane protein assembly factor BamB
VNKPLFPAAKAKPGAKIAAKKPLAKTAVEPGAKTMPKAKVGGMANMPSSFLATGDWKLRQGIPKADQSAVNFKWQMDKPEIQVRALVLADDTLFIAGPPDIVDEEAAFFALSDKDVLAQLARQSELLHGKDGARLWAVSAKTGKKLSEYRLDSLPVWDGMVAANGKLYLTTMDGKIACLAENAD